MPAIPTTRGAASRGRGRRGRGPLPVLDMLNLTPIDMTQSSGSTIGINIIFAILIIKFLFLLKLYIYYNLRSNSID